MKVKRKKGIFSMYVLFKYRSVNKRRFTLRVKNQNGP